jgi:hypothetical protein
MTIACLRIEWHRAFFLSVAVVFAACSSSSTANHDGQAGAASGGTAATNSGGSNTGVDAAVAGTGGSSASPGGTTASAGGSTASSGGTTNSGGTTRTSSSAATGGSSGGTTSSGGITSAGGTTSSGGTTKTGGSSATAGGAGGNTTTGTGGRGGTGGAAGTTNTAGTASSGGSGGTGGSGGGSSGVGGTATGTGTSTGTGGTSGAGDTYLPWAGGAAYYAKWTHGPPSDPSFFPLMVWLQDPSLTSQYKAIGINTFVGIWDGPTQAQINQFANAGVWVVSTQNSLAVADNPPSFVAWAQPDEPDNAQPAAGGGYGPCIDPSVLQANYQTWTSADPTRPIYLGLGQGVASTNYVGRGSCSGNTSMYPEYAQAADILCFDIYPVNEEGSNSDDPAAAGNLWYVAQGVDNLRGWVNDKKPVWNDIETTTIDAGHGTPTAQDITTEVWMSIVHGSMGIMYFCHIFTPAEDDKGLLDTPTAKAAVAAVNAQITALAPVLNTQSLANGATVTSSSPANAPIDIMVKRYQGALYIFAVAMRPVAATGKFTPRGVTAGTATVLGENRSIPISGGSFSDSFDGYAVHIYQLGPATGT